MSRINHINYEEFALDYLEGNLNPEMVREMESFLNLHPEIKAELDEMEILILSPDTSIVFDNKKALERPKRRKGGIAAWILGLLLLLGIAWIGNISQAKSKEKTEHEILKTSIIQAEKETLMKEEKIIIPQEETQQKVVKKVEPVKPHSNDSRVLPKTKTIEEVEQNTIFKPSVQPQPKPFFIPQEKQTEAEEKPMAQVKKPTNPPVTNPIQTEQKQRVITEINTLPTATAKVNFTREVFVDRGIEIVNKNALQEESLLGKIGLLPEGRPKRKLNLKTIKDALIPEAFASK